LMTGKIRFVPRPLTVKLYFKIETRLALRHTLLFLVID
jgi:hypothetical protein